MGMKGVIGLIVIVLYLTVSFAQTSEEAQKYEVKVIERLIVDATKKKNPEVYVYSEDKEAYDAFNVKIRKFARYIRLAKELKNSDFVIVLKLTKYKDFKKPALSLDFESVDFCGSCIGVFSWRNGRPSLVLFAKKLRKMKLMLPKEYSYFIE